MATVRITKDLINQIKANINNIGKTVLEKTIKTLDPISQPDIKAELVEVGLTAAWGKYLHLRTSIPSEWFVKKERLDIRVGDISELWIYADNLMLPPKTANGMSNSLSYFEVQVPASAVKPETYDALMSYQSKVHAHEDKYKGITQIVTQYIESSKSLNDAIKRFPDIALYVPDSIRARLDEKVERKSSTSNAALPAQPELTEEQRQLISSTGVLGTLLNS